MQLCNINSMLPQRHQGFVLAYLSDTLAARHVCAICRAHDFYRILTEPENNMLKQQQALMETEGIQMEFTDAAIREISRVAEEVRQLFNRRISPGQELLLVYNML